MLTTLRSLLSELFTFYDALFQPLLALGQYHSLAFFSIALAGIFSLIYWRLLDVERQQELKDKLTEQQEKMKEARENDNTDKVSEHMTKSLELNQKFMMLNFKPMIATMVFVALFFPWLSSTFSPTIQLDDGNGTYTGELQYASESVPIEVENGEEPIMRIDGEDIEEGENFEALGITWEFRNFGDNGGFLGPEGPSASVAAVFIPLPFSLWYIGSALNWLGFYVIMAMPLTFAFRKMLGIA